MQDRCRFGVYKMGSKAKLVRLLLFLEGTASAILIPVLPVKIFETFQSNALRPETMDDSPRLAVSLLGYAGFIECLIRLVSFSLIIDLSEKFGRKRLLLFSFLMSFLASLTICIAISVM